MVMFTKEMKEILEMLWWCFIISMTIAGIFHCLNYNKAMEKVRQETIEEAILVSSNEDGYVISFGGELHSYSFN